MNIDGFAVCYYVGSPAKVGGKKLAFARRQILQQSSTLIVHLYFLQVFLSVLFWKKYPKTGQSCTSFGAKSWQHCLFAPRAVQTLSALRTTICCQCCRFAEQIHKLPTAFAVAIFFSRCAPRRSQLVAMLGVARTRCAQTSCHLFPSIARLLTVPPNAALSLSATNYLLQWAHNGIVK